MPTYTIQRPSGHVVSRFTGSLKNLNARFDHLVARLGGYLEACDESGDLILEGGTFSMREFVGEYRCKNGAVIPDGTLVALLSLTKHDAHVDMYWDATSPLERMTFPRRDFMRATKICADFYASDQDLR